jgi:hypothetical protein
MKKNWKLDYDMYRNEIKFVSDSLREFKYNILRQSHVNNGAQVCWAQAQTIEEKNVATLLCSLRAHFRGKVHRQGWTLEQQEEWLDSNMDKWEHLVRLEDDESFVPESLKQDEVAA